MTKTGPEPIDESRLNDCDVRELERGIDWAIRAGVLAQLLELLPFIALTLSSGTTREDQFHKIRDEIERRLRVIGAEIEARP